MNKFLEVLATTAICVVFGVFVGVIVLEWLSGCGESWVQADGSRVMGECLFIGRW
jgi:hypothetical protein